jgi:FtsH-binding integral membrane protein
MNDGVRQWGLEHMWAFYVSLFGAIGLMIGAFITQRSYPTNMIFLGLFTLCESYSVGLLSSLFDTKIVLMAVLITGVVFVGLSLFALQTKYDMTSWQVYLGAGLWALIGIGFVGIFFPWGRGMELTYSILGALIFSVYIMVDTQLILNKYHPEDEVAAAVSLYLDIINLFLNILRILNQTNNNN